LRLSPLEILFSSKVFIRFCGDGFDDLVLIWTTSPLTNAVRTTRMADRYPR
jgi:hypothetical protein